MGIDHVRDMGIPPQSMSEGVCLGTMLVWVRVGGAVVRTSGSVVRVNAGSAAIMARGHMLAIEADRGSVVIPVELPDVGRVVLSADAPALVVNVTDSMEERLIHEFALGLGYLSPGPDAGAFAALLMGTVAEKLMNQTPGNRAGHVQVAKALEPRGEALMPPWPRTPAARAVAEAMMGDLAELPSLRELARKAAIGERTLQRHFSAETGLTPVGWRKEARLMRALELLRQGKEVGWTARQVGYSGAGPLSKAFQQRFGMSPGMCRNGIGDRESPERENADWLQGMEVPPIPAGSTGPRINGAYVVVWVFRGSCTAVISGRPRILGQGAVVVLPAGTVVEVSAAPGALVLPLGFIRAGAVGQLPDAIGTVPADPELENVLLHRVVSSYTGLKPKGGRTVAVTEIVAVSQRTGGSGVDSSAYGFTARRRGRGEPPFAGELVDIADTRWATAPLSEFAARAGVSPSIANGWFREDAGADHRRWAMIRRMTLAKAKLAQGQSLQRIAADLGYSQTSAFARAFSAFHGVGPAEFRSYLAPAR